MGENVVVEVGFESDIAIWMILHKEINFEIVDFHFFRDSLVAWVTSVPFSLFLSPPCQNCKISGPCTGVLPSANSATVSPARLALDLHGATMQSDGAIKSHALSTCAKFSQTLCAYLRH
jgi:hypothetical protein